MGLAMRQFFEQMRFMQCKWVQIATIDYRYFALILANTPLYAVECAHRLRGGAAR